MKIFLSAPSGHRISAQIKITGSKSESNRLLLLRALYPELKIDNLSNSDDTRLMQQGLFVDGGKVDIHHAGTAMRFLTAYFASKQGMEVVLTGSQRMQERPIGILVDALRDLGAQIEYAEASGFPPLKIVGKELTKPETSLPSNISSQYISALLLIAPSMPHGLKLRLEGKTTSVPYIQMTCTLLNTLGIETTFENNEIAVAPAKTVPGQTITVESDWSSASYFYSFTALAEAGSEIRLSSYRMNSLQGDSILPDIYASFGVSTSFKDNCIILRKEKATQPGAFTCDLANAPDLAQTVVVTCFGLGIGCELKGLHTLKIKETDRLEALKTELSKLGAAVETTSEELVLAAGGELNDGISVDTYHDHRMAMAFAPLSLQTGIYINDAGVVSKSYPGFWKDVKTLGIRVEES